MAMILSNDDAVETAATAGYRSRAYAESLAEFGEVLELPSSGGWMLARPTPQGPHRDAMGPYPLFGCRQWRGLNADVAALAGRAVCVSLVTDPLADVTPQQLGEVFTDVCSPFKEHYVCDLSRPLESVVAPHHRRHIRKALRAVEVRRCGADGATLAQWNALYDALAARHGIEGIARFSPQSFARQWAVPGMVALAAMEGDHCCGMTLWYVDGDDAYYHLAAYSERGYELSASYALFWTALRGFAAAGLRRAALGAGAGVTAIASGLTRFKQGWATETRTAYFCGRILDAAAYRSLSAGAPAATRYFPAYRAPRGGLAA